MGSMPAYDDVATGLKGLKDRGWKLVAFSNSSEAALTAGLKTAGIFDLYDGVVSVDLAKMFKPAAATYHNALNAMKASADEAIMVACHDWDLAGAKAVGMKTAFIKRKECAMANYFVPPDYTASLFTELPDLLGDAAK